MTSPIADINSAPLSGTPSVVLWPGPANDIVLDVASSQLYWSDTSGRIWRGASDGTGTASFVAATTSGENAHKLAFDPGAQTLYWADWNALKIYRYSLPSGPVQLLPLSPSAIGSLRDIAVDARSGKNHLYICTGTHIIRTDLNGANPVTLPNPVGPDVYGIAIDTCNDMLYMVGKTFPHPGVPEHYISRANLSDASGLTTLLIAPPGMPGKVGLDPFEIALDLPRGEMYWTAATGDLAARPLLGKANMDGSSPQFIAPPPGVGQYRGIVLDLARTQCCVPPPPNMVLWLSFDEIAGTIANNIVGAVNGVVTGGTQSLSGKVGDAQNCYPGNSVVVGDYPAINPGLSDFSIDAWVKTDIIVGPPCSRSGTAGIVKKRSIFGGTGYEFELFNPGSPCADSLRLVLDDGVNQQTFSASAAIVPLAKWTHVAVTVQRGAPSSVVFYIDGVGYPGGSAGTPVLGAITNSEPIEVGTSSSGGAFGGIIDEVEIFRRALAASEIQGIVNADGAGKCKEFCQVAWDRSFYDTDQFIDVPAQICNNTSTPQTYNLSIKPLACMHTSTPSPVGITFTPASPVTVPPGGCSTVWLKIPRPPFSGIGDLSCYELCMTNAATGVTATCQGSVQWSPSIRVEAFLVSAALTTAEFRDFSVLVENMGSTPATLPFRVSAIDPEMAPDAKSISLNDFEPGTAVEGMLNLAPGASEAIDFSAAFVIDDPGRWYTILIAIDLDGDGAYEPMESLSVTNTVEDPCPEKLVEDFEFYLPGGDLCGLNGWEPWAGSQDVCGEVVLEEAFSGMRSLKIVGSTGGSTGLGDDMVQTFDIEGGQHVLSMMTLIPAGSQGQGWVVMLSNYPQPFNWSLNLQLDADAGVIRDEDLPTASTPLMLDTWVPLEIHIDLDADTVDCYYNSVHFLASKSWTNGSGAVGLPRIEALDLYAGEPGRGGTTGAYFDDITLRTICSATPVCYADCDGSGALDFFDFLCFQNAFGGGDPYADCDRSGSLDFFDFLCFQNEFSAGCP